MSADRSERNMTAQSILTNSGGKYEIELKARKRARERERERERESFWDVDSERTGTAFFPLLYYVQSTVVSFTVLGQMILLRLFFRILGRTYLDGTGF